MQMRCLLRSLSNARFLCLQAVSEAGESVAEGPGRKSSKGAVWARKAEILEQARPEYKRRAFLI